MTNNQTTELPHLPQIEQTASFQEFWGKYEAATAHWNDSCAELKSAMDETYRRIAYYKIHLPAWRATIEVSKESFGYDEAKYLVEEVARASVMNREDREGVTHGSWWTLYLLNPGSSGPNWRFRFVSGLQGPRKEPNSERMTNEQVMCKILCLLAGKRPCIWWNEMSNKPKQTLAQVIENELKKINGVCYKFFSNYSSKNLIPHSQNLPLLTL